jgi:hypothetical protein
MKTLHLNLIKKWFDMILSGRKKEEYRSLSPYWVRRLVSFRNEVDHNDINEFISDLKNPYKRHDDVNQLMEYYEAEFKHFDNIHFKNGFARNGKPAPAFDAVCRGITVAQGYRAWGADDKFCFVIKLGLITKME